MKISFQIIIFLLLAFSIIQCKSNSFDCREELSCPIMYITSTPDIIYDGKTNNRIKDKILRQDYKVRLLVNKEGNPIKFDRILDYDYYKIESDGKEYYISAYYLNHLKPLRVSNSSGISLRNIPEMNNSVIVTSFPYNTKLILLSESTYVYDRNRAFNWYKVRKGRTEGWIDSRDVEYGEDSLEFNSKTLSQMISSVNNGATASNLNLELKWNGLETKNAFCRVKGNKCNFTLKFATIKGLETVFFYIKFKAIDSTDGTEKTKGYICENSKFGFMLSYTSAESRLQNEKSDFIEPVSQIVDCRIWEVPIENVTTTIER